MRQTDCLK